jgi:hypothetical protein
VSEEERLDPFTAVARALARMEAEAAKQPRKQPIVLGEPATDMDPPSGWLGVDDFETPVPGDEPNEDRDRRRRVFTRQVGIRLSPEQYAELSRAAEIYGVAPGTMARMLVKRGSRAVIDARRRYDLEQGGTD